MGEDLALVEGFTPQLIGRNALKKLWSRDELKQQMLSPKVRTKSGVEPRTDFSPIKKALFKGDKSYFLTSLFFLQTFNY